MFDFLKRPRTPFTEERVCYLHIGPHKTASTSLQHALSENADRLAKIGLAYPSIPGPDGKLRRNHSPLSRRTYLRLEGPLDDAPAWAEFGDMIRDVKGSLLVSSEHFAILMRKRRWFDKVVGFFERHGFRVVVVVFVRDQPLWLNSWYTQHQKNLTSGRDFAAFSEQVLRRGYMNPWRILRHVLRNDAVALRPIAFEQAAKAGLAKSFLAAIGAPEGFSLDEPPKINPNFGVKGMYAAQEIMRRVETPVRTLPDYIAIYERFLALMRGRDWDRTPYVAIDQAQYRVLREAFREANESFAEAYLGAPWSELAPEREVTRCVFDFDAASPADRADVMEVVNEMTALIGSSPRADQ